MLRVKYEINFKRGAADCCSACELALCFFISTSFGIAGMKRLT